MDYIPLFSQPGTESGPEIMTDLAIDDEKQTGLNEMLDGSARLLVRVRSPNSEQFVFSMESLERWDEYRHPKRAFPSYRKIMVALLIFAILVWQFLGLLDGSACDGPLAGAPLQVPGVPQFVLDYAPLVWLHVNESYMPSDMLAQVSNTTPKNENYEIISNVPKPLTLENLSDLNNFIAATNGTNGSSVFLTSNDDITTNPEWLNGSMPNPQTLATNGATSCAIIINDKGYGVVDAFYMYFYAYNQGNTVTVGYPPLGFSREIGDHVGDWEHSMIRFTNGKPSALWYSQHEFGASYTYDAVIQGGEVEGVRPYVYSAIGSHANYAVAGSHDHTIPDLPGSMGFLNDYTSRGFLWDPTLSAYFYNYNASTNSFSSLPVTGTGKPMGQEMSPVGAMDFKGQWGDLRYPDSDPRQEKTIGMFYKYDTGPTGPQDKQLQRTDLCPIGFPCIVRTQIGP